MLILSAIAIICCVTILTACENRSRPFTKNNIEVSGCIDVNHFIEHQVITITNKNDFDIGVELIFSNGRVSSREDFDIVKRNESLTRTVYYQDKYEVYQIFEDPIQHKLISIINFPCSRSTR